MKKNAADLHLHADPNSTEQASRLIHKAAKLGYRLVGIPFQKHAEEQMVTMRKVCEDHGLDLATRVDLEPRNPDELLRDLRRYRRQFELVAVLCESKNVARQAAKDRRVDILNFPQIDFRRRFFDRAEAELASNCLASLEIDVRPLLLLEGADRVRLLWTLRKEVATAQDFHVPVIVSSGVSDDMLIRKPMEVVALSSLFGLANGPAAEAVTTNPSAIIKRNREKLSPNFVAPGIRIVRRGKDC